MEYPIGQLRKIHDLSEPFIRDLGKMIRKLEPRRYNTLLLAGDICRDLYLIESGMLACFDVEGNKRYCTWIMTPGDFVSAVDSFNNKVVSTETIIALEKSRLWALARQNFEELTEKYLEFRAIRQILTDIYHIQSRVLDAKRKRHPEEFFDYLVENYRLIATKAPVTILASFMGISRPKLYEILKNRPGIR